jgi:hypothetical protein
MAMYDIRLGQCGSLVPQYAAFISTLFLPDCTSSQFAVGEAQ